MALPDDVTPDQLDAAVRQDLRSLARETAERVARHLVMAGRFLDDDPAQALTHAQAAAAQAGRVGAVREALGVTAYAAGEWALALRELRTARRITGSAAHLPLMADAERALGRPDRALAYQDDPQAATLEPAARVELAIVIAGARRDLGQTEAAVLLLRRPAAATRNDRPWAARLWYAYADALLAQGAPDQARTWFARAAEADQVGSTDAEDRLLELDGIVLLDQSGESDSSEPDAGDGQPARYHAETGGLETGTSTGDLPADVSPALDADALRALVAHARPVLPAASAPSGATAEATGTAGPDDAGSAGAVGRPRVPEVLFAPPPEAATQEGDPAAGDG